MLSKIIQSILYNITTFLGSIVGDFTVLAIETFEFLASSNDTTLVLGRNSTDDYRENTRQNGGGVASILSSAFMAPFKVAFATASLLPIGSMFESTKGMLVPLAEELMENPVIQSVTNATMSATEAAAGQVWELSKTHVLPQLDYLITKLQESNAVPEPIMKYLTDLQIMYHIFLYFGMA